MAFFQLWNFPATPARRVFPWEKKRHPAGESITVNAHWLVNLRRIVPEKTQWKWTRGMRQDSCDARFLWRKHGRWERSAASHINLWSHWTQDVFCLRKHMESGRVSATDVWVEKRYGIRERLVACHMNLQSPWTHDAFYLRKHKESGGGWYSAAFTWENTTISPGLARATFKFTVEMKPSRILHEKTQRFLRGRREWHVNLQSRWSPAAFYMRKHNDFFAVGRSDM